MVLRLIPLWNLYITWAMYILGLSSSWGTSRIRPAWFPFEHRLCPQSGARVRCHAVRRRLFIVLMTAAHISPNVFSLRNFLGTYMYYFHYTFTIIHTYCTLHSSKHLHPFIYMLNHSFISSALHGRPAALGLLCRIQLNVPKMAQKRKNSCFKNVLELNFATIKESAFWSC